MSAAQLKVYYLVLGKIEESDTHVQPKMYHPSDHEIDEFFTNLSKNMGLSKTARPNRFYSQIGGEPRWVLLHADDSQIPIFDDYLCGLFIKSRSSKWPYKEDTDGRVSQIDGIRGMAEVSYFVIDKINSRVIYTANQFVGGHKSFQGYLNEKILELRNDLSLPVLTNGKKTFLFELNLILNITNIDNLIKKNIVKKFFMRVVRPKNYDITQEDSPLEDEVDMFINNLKWVKTQNIEFSADRSGLLQSSKLRKFIRFIRKNPNLVTKATITDETSKVIDLLDEDYIVFSMIDYPNKYMPYKEIFKNLINEYKNQTSILEGI